MSNVMRHVAFAACKSGVVAFALRWQSSNPLIFMYHGVANVVSSNGLQNCEKKHIPLDVFVAHLKTFRRLRKVISLADMVEGIRNGDDLQNTVAITFDDGYENNFLRAAPVLADFKMPAAFFLITGFIGTDRSIWTDQLEVILDQTTLTSVSMPSLQLKLPLHSVERKQHALRTLKEHLKLVTDSERLTHVSNLTKQLSVAEVRAEGDYRFMNWEQARGLASAGFEIGAHSENHPILSRMPFEDASREILCSRDRVLAEIGHCSTSFVYPNGQPADYTEEIMQFCRLHFRAAISTKRGSAHADEVYELRRLSPPRGLMATNVEWLLFRER